MHFLEGLSLANIKLPDNVCVLCCSTRWFETAVCSELCHLKDTFITQWKGERKIQSKCMKGIKERMKADEDVNKMMPH